MSNDLPDDILTILKDGKLSIQGEFVWGSNYTFLAEVEYSRGKFKVVYKPTRGERPLWDFPTATLARREAAAYLVSEAINWKLVPPTIYRRKGPLGAGSLQLFIEHDPEYHYFNFSEADRQRLRPVAIFDLLVNNADRKGSHIMLDETGHLWLIDHGICFHVDEKLRTVVWDFAGEYFPDELCSDLRRFIQKLQSIDGSPSELALSLKSYLSAAEISALYERARRLLAVARFPNPNPNRRPYPWPPV